MSKKEKTNKGIPIYRIIILIAVILIIVLIGYMTNKNKGQEGTSKNNQQQTAEQGEQVSEVSLIDMNNTENAKIESGVKENTSENISKDRKLGNLSITDIKLSAQDGVTSFTATVKNNSTKDFAGGIVKITFTNKDGSNYAELEASIPQITAGGINAINAGTTADIANAYDFTMELEK